MANRNAAASRTVALPRLSLADRTRARWEGVRDGRRGWPLPPLHPAADGSIPPATSSYQSKLGYMANEAALKWRGQFFQDNTRLAAEIFLAAGVVVAQDAAGTCSEAHKGRFRSSLMTWAMRAETVHARAEAATARANQQLDWYWAAVCRSHRGLRAVARQRQDALAAQWSRQPPAPAGQAIADLATWRPMPVRLDPAWPNPLELLKQWTVSRGDAEAYQYGVLLSALEIVSVPA